MENSKKIMLVIAGATGVGKTDVALQLAEYAPIEIVNADLGQFYEPLTIGTAKPDWKKSSIKHHLFDIFSIPHICTVMQYRSLVKECLQAIWDRNNIPVLVGGSTFYIESLFFEPQESATAYEQSLQEAVSWHELNAVDPLRASQIHPNDSYRIKRALSMWHATGIKPSLQKPLYNPLAENHWFIALTRNRDDLYTRINQRVKVMIDTGWISEVQSLINTPWIDFVQSKKFIGYPELIDFVTKQQTSYPDQALLDIIAQKTRNYAKRQETYWRRLEKKLSDCLVQSTEYTNKQMSRVIMSNITNVSYNDYCKKLSEELFNKSESSDKL